MQALSGTAEHFSKLGWGERGEVELNSDLKWGAEDTLLLNFLFFIFSEKLGWGA